MINQEQILKAQKEWGNGVVKIGSLKDDRQECEKFTNEFLDKLYAFDLGKVLFKPTMASEIQFRTDKIGALSYFIGGNHDFSEDRGFAISPWKKEVHFSSNFHLILEEKRALAMGNYYFTDMNDDIAKVEYTFGYRLHNGQLKIDLHHSSFPFIPFNR